MIVCPLCLQRHAGECRRMPCSASTTPSASWSENNCDHRGQQLRTERCQSCGGVRIKVFGCALHRECQLGDKLRRLKSCASCEDRSTTEVLSDETTPRSEPGDTYPKTITAPLFNRSVSDHPWEGASQRKAWQYRVTATIPVLNPTDSLACVIETLRAQTERPYVIVVDTGSTWSNLETLHRRYESDEDVEIHSLRSRGWRHSSAPVGAALDVALAVCHSEFLYMTHDDVFLKRNDYLSDLLAMFDSMPSVAIGYQMSPRDWLTDQWQGMVSHTATLCHAPTLRRIGASWSFERSHDQFAVPRGTMGWPDTETAFGLLLKSLGMTPTLIGNETNYERFEDDNLVHCRSYTGSKLYSAAHHAKSSEWIADELANVKRRLGGV